MHASSDLPEGGRKLCIDLTFLTIGTITSHFLVFSVVLLLS